MFPGHNKLTLLGTITKQGRVRPTPLGGHNGSIATAQLQVPDGSRKADDGSPLQTLVSVNCFGGMARAVASYGVGSRLLVFGRVSTDGQGQLRIVCEQFEAMTATPATDDATDDEPATANDFKSY